MKSIDVGIPGRPNASVHNIFDYTKQHAISKQKHIYDITILSIVFASNYAYPN